MKLQHIILSLSIIFSCNLYAQAQESIRGIVHSIESEEKLSGAEITNLSSSKKTESDKEGKFMIDASLNDLLEIKSTGYQTDTAFIYHFDGVYRIYMLKDDATIQLDEVIVSRLTDSRLSAEIAKAKREGKFADASVNQGGIRFSPSRIFGKDAKNARKNLSILEVEQNSRIIDRRFNDKLILSLLPLNQSDLALFMERYRPNIEDIENASDEDLRVYILDSYQKFKNDN